MNVALYLTPSGCFIVPEGELDTNSSALFEQSLVRAMELAPGRIIIDCTSVRYISSAGLGVIIAYLRELEYRSIRLALSGVSQDLRQLLDLVSLVDYIELTDEPTQIVAASLRRISVPGNLESISLVRHFLAQYLAQIKVNRKQTYAATLAVDELATNLVKHGLLPGSDQPITIEVTLETGKPHMLQIRLIDQGVPFDPVAHESPSVDELTTTQRKGGLGLSLVKKLMSRVEYYHQGDSNICAVFLALDPA